MPDRYGNPGQEGETIERYEEDLEEPERFHVVLLNDHYTTMEFVIEVLKTVFHKPFIEATRIMLNVHTQGRGIAGTYGWDIADTKKSQVMEMARKRGFPLECVVERAA